jgi:hypothetical protein
MSRKAIEQQAEIERLTTRAEYAHTQETKYNHIKRACSLQACILQGYSITSDERKFLTWAVKEGYLSE